MKLTLLVILDKGCYFTLLLNPRNPCVYVLCVSVPEKLSEEVTGSLEMTPSFHFFYQGEFLVINNTTSAS